MSKSQPSYFLALRRIWKAQEVYKHKQKSATSGLTGMASGTRTGLGY